MPHSSIDSSIERLNLFFDNDWWSKYKFDKENRGRGKNSTESKIKQFQSDLIVLHSNVIDNINISILQGEYIQPNYISKIQGIRSIILEKAQPIDVPETLVQEALITSLSNDFNKSIEFALKRLNEFALFVQRRLIISDKILRFNISTEEYNPFNEYSDTPVIERAQKNIDILLLNIRIGFMDHAPSEDLHRTLIRNSTRLKNHSDVIYVPYIIQKSDYLIGKWILRWQAENPDAPKSIMLMNSEEQPLSHEKLTPVNFKPEIETISNHYQLSNGWVQNLSENYLKNKSVQIDNTNNRILHGRIKYFKDCSTNIILLEKVRNSLYLLFTEVTDGNQNSAFDSYALAINLNYAINNELSVLCDNKNAALIEVEKKYRLAQSIQSETGIKNFFPHYKFLNFLVTRIDKVIQDNKALDEIEECNKIFKLSEEAIREYENSVKWTRRNYPYAFQLSFNECFYQLDNFKLFIASSYILPLPKEKYIEEFETLRRSFYEKKPSIAVLTNIDYKLKENESMLDEIRNREARTMEILGIFTAIISFVAASIQSFAIIKSPQQAFSFMLALSTSFASFVLLILMVFRGSTKVKKSIGWIIGFSITAAVFWAAYLFTSSTEGFKTSSKEKHYHPRNNQNNSFFNSDTFR